MLVLTREKDESIWIGDSKVTVVRVGHHKVRLGIDAEAGMKILRGELRSRAAGQDGLTLTQDGQTIVRCESVGGG